MSAILDSVLDAERLADIAANDEIEALYDAAMVAAKSGTLPDFLLDTVSVSARQLPRLRADRACRS